MGLAKLQHNQTQFVHDLIFSSNLEQAYFDDARSWLWRWARADHPRHFNTRSLTGNSVNQLTSIKLSLLIRWRCAVCEPVHMHCALRMFLRHIQGALQPLIVQPTKQRCWHEYHSHSALLTQQSVNLLASVPQLKVVARCPTEQ